MESMDRSAALNMALHQSWLAGWSGHHMCGLPTMVGLPTINSAMCKASTRKANKHCSLGLNMADYRKLGQLEGHHHKLH